MTWLLTITYAGREFRWASEPVEIDGYQYDGGLEPAFSLGAEPGALQRDLEVDLGSVLFDVDVAEWVRRGRLLLGAEAVLSTYRDGLVRVRARGVVDAAEVGAFGEPVALRMRWTPPDSARVVPEEAEVNVDTWNTAEENVYGKPYVRVLGRPGLGLVTTTAQNNRMSGGSQLTVVDTTPGSKHDYRLLVCDGAAPATTCTLIQVNGDQTTLVETGNTLAVTTDGLGRTVTTVVPIGMAVETESAFWIDWTSAVDGDGLPAGGTAKRDGSGSVRSFGDALYWLVGESALTFDEPEWRRLPAILSSYEIGYYVDTDASPLDIVEELISLLPVSVIPGPDGLRPVVWDVAATGGVALVEGDNVARLTGAALAAEDVSNDLSLAWGPRADNGEPYATARAYEENNAACAASQTWLGRRRETVDAVGVYTSETADRIVHGLASLRALPVERVRYEDCAGLDLDVGAVVRVTDDALHYDERYGLVVEVSYSGPVTEYVVAMYTVPGRDTLGA